MAKKKATKEKIDTPVSENEVNGVELDTTVSVQEGVGQLDTTNSLDTVVSKNEEIGNANVQLVEQSQSETDSTQVGGEEIVFAEGIAPKTSQQAQEEALEGIAIGEPTSEQEKAMDELVRLSEELGMYAEDSPELIATDKEQDSDTIAPSEEDIATDNFLKDKAKELGVTESDYEASWDDLEVIGSSEEHAQLSDLTVEEVQEALGIEPEVDYTSVEIKGVNFIEAVKSILYAGSLGAIIDPKYRPQLGRVPYSVRVLVPSDMLEVYQNKEDMQEYDENVQYNVASVSCLDVGRFVEQLLEVGEQGAVLHPKKATNNFVNYTAAICSLFPFSDSAVIKTKPEKRQYTYKELHEFKMKQLKVIASWYKIRNQPKWLLVQRILTAQRELQENEERNKLGS